MSDNPRGHGRGRGGARGGPRGGARGGGDDATTGGRGGRGGRGGSGLRGGGDNDPLGRGSSSGGSGGRGGDGRGGGRGRGRGRGRGEMPGDSSGGDSGVYGSVRGGGGPSYYGSPGSRGGGRGDRGGRGGGGMGRGFPRPVPEAFSYVGYTPAVDREIRALEDQLMGSSPTAKPAAPKTKTLGVQLPQLQVRTKPSSPDKGKAKDTLGAITTTGSSAGGRAPANDLARFPLRPAFGTEGQKTILYANFFQLSITVKTLFQYNVTVSKRPPVPAGSDRATGTAGTGGTGGTGGRQTPREIKGAFLKKVMKHIVENRLAGPGMVVASEFKNKIITRHPLSLNSNATLDVEFEGCHFDVHFDGPITLSVEDLNKWLTTMKDARDDNNITFPKYADIIDAIGIIMGHTPRIGGGTADDVVAVGKSRFFSTAQPTAKQPQYQVLDSDRKSIAIRGYFQSVRPATGRLLLNVNVTHGVFRQSMLVSEMYTGAKNTKFFPKLIKGLRALVTIPNRPEEQQREFTVWGLATKRDTMARSSFNVGRATRLEVYAEHARPTQIKFMYQQHGAPLGGLANNQMCTVKDYLEAKFETEVNDRYPVVNVGRGNSPIYYPSDWCNILPGQPVRSKLTGAETASMIKFACRKPDENAKSITETGRQVLQLDDALQPFFKQFGITVGHRLITVEARILRFPQIVYSVGKGFAPKNGSWNMAERKVAENCSESREMAPWTFVQVHTGNLSFETRRTVESAVTNFGEYMHDKMAIHIREKPERLISHEIALGHAAKRDAWINGIREAFTNAAGKNAAGGNVRSENLPRLILFVLDKSDKAENKEAYEIIKRLGDTEFGIHTVCVIRSKFTRTKGSEFDKQYFANVGLKVNLKLGGRNHTLEDAEVQLGIVSEGQTMVVGYDVIHPTNVEAGVDAEKLPSQVGLVASIDKHLVQYPAVCWEQRGRQEMVSDQLTESLRSRIVLWQKKNPLGLLKNILVYRDGVSEGQFAQVLDKELPLMRKAFQGLFKPSDEPKITIVVSVKRHNTRFFPTTKGNSTGNVECGTVVDRSITLQRYWDFYLTAHAAIQGTARSARYTVVYDEIFKPRYGAKAADELEKLTHNMCYLFNRATKAVSICPPAKYADMVCTRARIYQGFEMDAVDADAASTTSTNTIPKLPQVHANIRDEMFYV